MVEILHIHATSSKAEEAYRGVRGFHAGWRRFLWCTSSIGRLLPFPERRPPSRLRLCLLGLLPRAQDFARELRRQDPAGSPTQTCLRDATISSSEAASRV